MEPFAKAPRAIGCEAPPKSSGSLTANTQTHFTAFTALIKLTENPLLLFFCSFYYGLLYRKVQFLFVVVVQLWLQSLFCPKQKLQQGLLGDNGTIHLSGMIPAAVKN